MAIENILSLNDAELEKLSFTRATDCISTTIDGDTVILSVKSGKYSGLNEVGSVVWNVLEKPVALAEIQATVLEQFNVSTERCRPDILTFLKSLAEQNLIEVKIETDR